ncbi:MAG: MFS transporter [Hyphomicrobiales bacterium]|nr:MFS transporter [Hyphomicrobiales bacterium]
MTDATRIEPAQALSGRRLIAACTIGNALEFYDFMIFSFFALTIGALFFPVQNPNAQLLLSLATYGVGFFLRPVGGFVLGAFADRKGRKAATILTLFMMATGTAMIGLAPTYAQAGAVGPLIVVLGRLIQGFSAGGEVGASTTLLAEQAPTNERGFYGSWQLASQGIAVLVAATAALTVSFALPPDAVKAWGWRIPFLLGILIIPIGLWLRSALHESHANEDSPETRNVAPVARVFSDHLGKLIAGIGMVVGGTAANAIVVLYMATYAVKQLGLAPASALLAGCVAGLVTAIVAPLGGRLSDAYGRKRVAGFAYVLMILLIYPGFLLLNASPTLPTLLAVVVVLASLNASGGAPIIITLAEIFPVEVRATGMSLVYALGVAIFGGFGQFIVTWLIQASGNPIAPAWYVIACCIVTLVSLRFIPEMARQKLSL